MSIVNTSLRTSPADLPEPSPDGPPVRVLVVDDEPALTELLSMALRYEGWEVHTAPDGPTALDIAATVPLDLVVLDVMLPGMDGWEVLRRLRAQVPAIPALFLTARESAQDRALCFAAGGDDHMGKPFSLTELVTRLTRLLHRAGRIGGGEDPPLVVGDLTFDEAGHLVRRGGQVIELTATEFDLLRLLVRNAGRVLSRAEILDAVWHHDFGGNIDVVELFVSYLRRKVDGGRPAMIHAVPGAGYLLRST
jgi:two-component system OmpR family response regulator